MKKNRLLVSLLIHVFLIAFSIVMIVPFVWMVLTSFKSITEATSVNPFVIFPSEWRTASFSTVWKNMSFLRLYRNTLLLIFWRVVCACLTATFAGYAFARLRFRGKNLAFGVVLVQMMIPTQIFVIPQYLMISRLGANNTMFALVFPGLVTAFGTFLLRQAYMGLPGELEEVARLDGCNIPQTFIFVMAPLATMQGQYSTKYPELMAASLIACLPMVVLYLLFQRQFIEGIATSGGKL